MRIFNEFRLLNLKEICFITLTILTKSIKFSFLFQKQLLKKDNIKPPIFQIFKMSRIYNSLLTLNCMGYTEIILKSNNLNSK